LLGLTPRKAFKNGRAGVEQIAETLTL
jgi:hypothetical protein